MTADPTQRTVFVDHVTLLVGDLDASRRFYEAALAPLDARSVELSGGEVAFGPPGSEDFGLGPGGPVASVHVAFAARAPEQVDAFYSAALGAGGQDNGAPGERPHYHPGYYAAYVLDPDGHNVEAVFHGRP